MVTWYKNTITGTIRCFSFNPGEDWIEASQAEIDAETLKDDKLAKIRTLKENLETFQNFGKAIGGGVFRITSGVVENVKTKDGCSASIPDRYKFFDKYYDSIDFADAAGFMTFRETLFAEMDRIMRKYCDYLSQINACLTVAGVDAITIDFSI